MATTINQKPLREILVKRPWLEIQPDIALTKRTPIRLNGRSLNEPIDHLKVRVKTQSDFIRELNPSSHKIMNPLIYPDIWKQDPDSKRWYQQPITRRTFAFQAYIRDKQTEFLTGNDVQMELTAPKPTDEEVSNLHELRKGWLECGMETAMHESVEGGKTVGDSACLIYTDKQGEIHYKVYSFADDNRYKLYPHFDDNGDLALFAVKYYDLDENGAKTTEWVEVWDDTTHYICKRAGVPTLSAGAVAPSAARFMVKIRDFFGIDGYEIVKQEPHGATFVPIAYFRDPEGPCWTRSQATIEAFEESMSWLAEGNKAYAFPIFYVKGDGVSVVGDMNGSVKSIDLPADGEAGYISRQDTSESFQKEIDWLYRLIHEQSFITKPIEVKSGDLPGVAIKLLYTLTLEKAMKDAAKWQPFVDKLLKVFAYYYGIKNGNVTALTSIPMHAWIKPYVHMNDAELFQNMMQGVQNKFLSKQTASERISEYSKNGEYDRILAEMQADADLETQKANAQTEFKEQMAEKQTEASVRIQAKYANGNAVGDSGGDKDPQGKQQGLEDDKQRGQGRKRLRMTDEHGNRPFENNWNK